jgi:putative nucleotidyltransferase with HDIG domain
VLTAFNDARDTLINAHDSDLRLLNAALEFRDPATAMHSVRVAEYVARFATHLGAKPASIERVTRAAILHDIGKIGVRDDILFKSSPLTHDERELVKKHVEFGATLLELHGDLRHLAPLVRHHHERWDGCGYPDGLTGTEIPFGARLIALVDSFDVMTVDRPYRKALPVEYAMEELRRNARTQFDPSLVALFIAFLNAHGEERDGDQDVPSGALTGASSATVRSSFRA